MTPLDKPLKRALRIKGRDYVVTLSPETIKLTEKGHRLGMALAWEALVSGDVAFAVALQASVGRFETQAITKKDKAPPRRKPSAASRPRRAPHRR